VSNLTNEFILPIGCEYVEFFNIDGIPKALLFKESETHGGKIKVCINNLCKCI
jgi:hypothetical protein